MEKKKATLELGTKPVGRLLAQYALPAIIAMTASSLYNMVDSIFIGQGVGALAISGLAVTFPFMNLSAAFGAGVGVGASSYLSVKLGQKDYTTAQRILGNNVTLNILIGVVFSVVSLVFLDPILYFFGASDQTIPYAREYMIVILLGNVITHLYFGMNAVLRAASKPRQAMYTTIFTVVLNSVLDPLFIYTFDMGIQGAAFATILSQAVALAWQIRLFSDRGELLHLRKGIYRPEATIIRNILAIGVSPFAMNATACLVSIFVNQRLMRVLTLAMIAGTCVTTTGFVVAEFIPHLCVRLFTSDDTLTQMSVDGIRIMMAAMPIVGYQMIVTNFFQSIGKAKISIFLSLSRQLLFLLPLLAIMPHLMGVKGVWIAMPLSDTASALFAMIMMVRYMRMFKRQHKAMTANGDN